VRADGQEGRGEVGFAGKARQLLIPAPTHGRHGDDAYGARL